MIAAFREIANTSGAKSTEKKRGLIKKLLVSSREMEAGYIVRSLQGKLRIGLAQQSVITALAQAVLMQVSGTADQKRCNIGRNLSVDLLCSLINIAALASF